MNPFPPYALFCWYQFLVCVSTQNSSAGGRFTGFQLLNVNRDFSGSCGGLEPFDKNPVLPAMDMDGFVILVGIEEQPLSEDQQHCRHGSPFAQPLNRPATISPNPLNPVVR